MAAGALSALVVMASSGAGHRQPLSAADDIAAGVAAPPTAPNVRPAGKVEPENQSRYAIERALAADRRADAREAADRRADWLAAQALAPVPVAPAAPAAGDFSFAALESLWRQAGGPSWAAAQAASIAECESGGNPNAYNPSGASGLWQILGQDVPGNIFDPLVNAENAVAKFRASGDTFAQWVC